jgi:hypothetical protein
MSIILNKEVTTPIVDWFANNIESVKKDLKGFGARQISFHLGNPLIFAELQRYDNKQLRNKDFPMENLERVEVELREHFNIPKESKYASMGILIAYSEKGYLCRTHRDKTPDNDHCHVRLNVLISKPEIGGNPIIIKSGRYFDKHEKCTYPIITSVKENEPWICLASEFEHSTTLQDGDTPRIMISLGYNVPRKILEEHGYLKAPEETFKNAAGDYDDTI